MKVLLERSPFNDVYLTLTTSEWQRQYREVERRRKPSRVYYLAVNVAPPIKAIGEVPKLRVFILRSTTIIFAKLELISLRDRWVEIHYQ